MVDNFHYLTRVEKNSTEVEAVASKTLKGIASECRIPVIVLQHPTKPGLKEKEPEVYDSRGSSSILNDASNVVILHRPLVVADGEQTSDRYNVGTLKIGKARWGKGGRIHLRFDGAKRTFQQTTYDDYKQTVKASKAGAPARSLAPTKGKGAAEEGAEG